MIFKGSAAGRMVHVWEIDHQATGKGARQYREERGLSIRKVAQRMGLSASFVSDLELGRRHWTDALTKRFKKACDTVA